MRYVRRLIPFLAAVAIIGAFAAVPRIWPDGFSAGPVARYEGLLVIPAEGWEFATLDTRQLLEKNVAERPLGKQTVETICLLAQTDTTPLRHAYTQAALDRSGARALWVRIRAEPRLATGSCMNRAKRSGKQSWGRYLRIEAVESAQPIPCGYIGFILNDLRCPVRRPGSSRSVAR